MKIFYFLILLLTVKITVAQELFVSTEPASNMAKGSIGIRLNAKVFKMNYSRKFESHRIEPEVMIGLNKNLMIHVAAYGSDMFQRNIKFEGASLYGKYRFYSSDEVHTHFRLAAYAKASVIRNPQTLHTIVQNIFPDGNGGFTAHTEEKNYQSNDIDLDGNNSGVAIGIIGTKLINRLAMSTSAGYISRVNNIGHNTENFQPLRAINYTASAGYLLFPREYTSYRQTNFNLYIEMLGQSFTDKKQFYMDVAPAAQFIFNSIARLDISYRAQFAGNIKRLSNNSFMLRLEYNLLNIF